MTDKIGPSFASELVDADVFGACGWNGETGALIRCVGTSDEDFAKAEAVLAKHDPTKPGPAAPVIVSGDALIDSLSDAQVAGLSTRDVVRLAVRDSVPVTNPKLKRIAAALKTTPDALLAAAAGG